MSRQLTTAPSAPNPHLFRVGIVLATYNCDRVHFAAQVDSIKHQDFADWVCLVTDDGSTPEIRQYIAAVIADDPRFIYHGQPHNLGSYHNFEYGVQYFRSDPTITHLAFADQDDVWHANKLSKLLAAIEAHDALLVHSDLGLIDTDGNPLHDSVWQYEKRQPEQLTPELLLLRNTVTGCTMLLRRSLIAHILPFPPQGQTGHWYHDHWIALVAAQQGRIMHLREPLMQYRQHGRNVIGAEQYAGTIRKELVLWLAKKGRLTLKSYRIHRDLSTAFFQRFYPSAVAQPLNPFAEQRLDFGVAILQLGWRSYRTGYGSQGITLRLWLNKFIFDLQRVKRTCVQAFTNSRAQ